MKIHNRFDVYRKKIGSDKIEQIAFAENILLNGYYGIMYGWAYNEISSITYGEGTGILSADRTTLFTAIASASADQQTYSCDLEIDSHVDIQNIGIGFQDRHSVSVHVF